jgi:transposase
MKMLSTLNADLDIEIDTLRLDKYYSFPPYFGKFDNAKVYVIPKNNASLNGSKKWKSTMKDFVENIIPYLGQYYLRNNSEIVFFSR